MPYLVHSLHLCYFTEGGTEGQDLVGCDLGYQASVWALRPTASGVEDRGPAVILQFHANATRNVVRPSFSYCNFKLFRNLSDSKYTTD